MNHCNFKSQAETERFSRILKNLVAIFNSPQGPEKFVKVAEILAKEYDDGEYYGTEALIDGRENVDADVEALKCWLLAENAQLLPLIEDFSLPKVIEEYLPPQGLSPATAIYYLQNGKQLPSSAQIARLESQDKELINLKKQGSDPWVVVREFVQNALDALRAVTDREGFCPEISLRLGIVEKDGKPHLFLEFVDNGIGMGKKDLLKLMEPYANSKEDNPGALGQFGAGFKTAYNSADEVLITTSKDGETLHAQIHSDFDPKTGNLQDITVESFAKVENLPDLAHGTRIVTLKKIDSTFVPEIEALKAAASLLTNTGLLRQKVKVSLQEQEVKQPEIKEIFTNQIQLYKTYSQGSSLELVELKALEGSRKPGIYLIEPYLTPIKKESFPIFLQKYLNLPQMTFSILGKVDVPLVRSGGLAGQNKELFQKQLNLSALAILAQKYLLRGEGFNLGQDWLAKPNRMGFSSEIRQIATLFNSQDKSSAANKLEKYSQIIEKLDFASFTEQDFLDLTVLLQFEIEFEIEKERGQKSLKKIRTSLWEIKQVYQKYLQNQENLSKEENEILLYLTEQSALKNELKVVANKNSAQTIFRHHTEGFSHGKRIENTPENQKLLDEFNQILQETLQPFCGEEIEHKVVLVEKEINIFASWESEAREGKLAVTWYYNINAVKQEIDDYKEISNTTLHEFLHLLEGYWKLLPAKNGYEEAEFLASLSYFEQIRAILYAQGTGFRCEDNHSKKGEKNVINTHNEDFKKGMQKLTSLVLNNYLQQKLEVKKTD